LHELKQEKSLNVRKFSAVVFAGAAVVAAQLVAVPAASAAVPGYQIVQAQTGTDSATYKSVTVNCPSGKRVVGAGYHLLGADGNIVLDDLIPGVSSVTVGAGEDQDGTSANWKITGIAICANPLPGHEVVTATSGFGPGDSRRAAALCPPGKKVVGAGTSLSQGFGHISVGNLITDQNAVYAYAIDDQDGFGGSWSVSAYAVCAFAPVGLEYPSSSSAYNSNSPKVQSANCSAGKVALGQTWSMSGDGQVLVTFAGVGQTGITQVANEDDDGYFDNWGINPGVICATA
jgi:hypothetical protein